MNKKSIFTALGVLCLFSLHAQDKKKWDVNVQHGPFKEVEFTTQEGTWMNLDLSPDGNTIVFDLLGDIYSIPVSGGDAKILRSGNAWETQPRFSPDGKKISFTSDAGGGDNIWTMKTDGSDAKQITQENYRLLNNAVWTNDGNYLVCRKHFTSTRSLGAGEIWMYHITGGEGIQLTARKNDQQDVGEPCVSPDGKYVYFSEDMYPGGFFQYNKDPNNQIYVIRRYNIEKGNIEDVVTGAGGAMRPQISRDGKLLSFVRRIREKTCLFVRDLSSGEEWQISDALTKDQQEAWAIFGAYCNYSWTPDNQHIIIWSNGQMRKMKVYQEASTAMTVVPNNETVIPFKAVCKHKITDALRFKQDIDPEKFTAKMIRQTVTSPDGKFIVFNAIGYLWKKDLPNGKPERITTNADFEFEPNFSVNGQEIVYVTWNDETMSNIFRYNFKTKKSTKVNSEKGIFRTPKFSPDGTKIVFQKEGGNDQQGFTFSNNPGLYWIPANGGEHTLISQEGENPVFSADGKRIFYLGGGYPEFQYKSCDLTGNHVKTHFTSKYANDFSPSPDNKWIAFRELYNVYIAPFPATGKSLDLSGNMGSVPVSKVTRDAGIAMHWSADSKKLHWTLGEEYYGVEVKNRFKFLQGSPDSIPPVDTVGLKIGLDLPSDKPKGRIAFTNARIITMNGNEVIENGTIIISGNKIEEIGKSTDVKVPQDAKVYDVKGKTIMPGMVDAHAHVGHFRSGLNTQKHWPYFANLAYGVTTTHDPSANTEFVFSQSELVKAGKITGPRIFSTGTILYGAEGDFKAVVNNIEDARSALRRTKAFGAFSVKSYNQPRREQRQMIIQAAREQNVMVVPEGGSTFYYNMTHIMDGHTGVEHNIPIAPLFNDVIQFWKNSKTGYTPTLIVAYGAMNGEFYWYQHTDVWAKTRLLNFTPRTVIDSRARHIVKVPEEEYKNGHMLISESCKALADQGVKVNMGAHGQIQGIGAHWETWMLTQGGMSNHEALKAATINSAAYIGLDSQIGSLEKGKLADLIIMDKNPLENIYNTESIIYTMINGRLFDSETMNEIGNEKKDRTKFYWELPKASGSFIQDGKTGSFGHGHCVCGKH